ncbi:MAG TPA: hypothetical protein VMV93_01525 [Chloroflexota bacterium]|nr:hypothetical protein [Chloroflexota bacterium]
MPRPPIGLDMDGVICTPLLGSNMAISRRLGLPPLPELSHVRDVTGETRRVYLKLRRRWEFVRYMGRHPLPGVREGLEELGRLRQLVLITGRSWHARQIIEHWLAKYDLAQYFADVLPNTTNLSTAHYKLWTVNRLGIREHIDDDGSIACYLASHDIRVFLTDWPRNLGLPYPEGVTRIHRLVDAARALRQP